MTTCLRRKAVLIIAITLLLSLAANSALGRETIKIAAIFAHSGKAMYSNKPAIDGTRMAVAEINRQGGILGKQIELLEIDNKSSPIGSHFAALQAAQQEVTGIIGASWSSHSMAVARVAQENKIVMISPISTLPELTAVGDYIFRVCYNDNFQGHALATFAYNDLRMRSAMVFIDVESDFSLNLSKVFCETFEAFGGKIVSEIEYKSDQSNYMPQIAQAQKLKADLVFLSGHDESGYIAKELSRNKVHAIPLGSDGWDAKSFFTRGGHAIRQGYYINHWIPNPDDPESLEFSSKVNGGGEVKAPTALAYDAVYIFAEAVKKAGSEDHSSIRDALSSITEYHGITGTISFNAQGDATKQACIVEIRDGVPKFLKSITD